MRPIHNSVRVRDLALALLGALACGRIAAAQTPTLHYAIELGSNAISVWNGAFRINGGAGWSVDTVSASDREFAATYRSPVVICRFTVASTNVPAGTIAADLNAQTRDRARSEYERVAVGARHISRLSERAAGTALVLVWDYQDADGRYHVRNQAALQPVAGRRTVLATKTCESDAALDSSSEAVKGLRAEFNFEAPYWAAP